MCYTRLTDDVCLEQRKPEDASETVEAGADETKKAKPSEETNGAGDEADGDTGADEQQAVLYVATGVAVYSSVCLSVRPIAHRPLPLADKWCS